MSVPLKPKGKGSILTGVSMGGVGSGAAAMANSFAGMSSLGKEIVGLAGDMAVERKDKELREGLTAAEDLGRKQAGNIGEDGKLVPLTSGFDLTGGYEDPRIAERYRNTVFQTQGNARLTQFNANLSMLAEKYQHDPVEFDKKTAALQEAVLQNSPREFYDFIKTRLNDARSQKSTTLKTKLAQERYANQKTNLEVGSENAARLALNHAYSGNGNSAEAQRANEDYVSNQLSLAENHHQTMDEARQNIDNHLTELTTANNQYRLISAFNEDGIDAATKILAEINTADYGTMDPDKAERIKANAQASLNRHLRTENSKATQRRVALQARQTEVHRDLVIRQKNGEVISEADLQDMYRKDKINFTQYNSLSTNAETTKNKLKTQIGDNEDALVLLGIEQGDLRKYWQAETAFYAGNLTPKRFLRLQKAFNEYEKKVLTEAKKADGVTHAEWKAKTELLHPHTPDEVNAVLIARGDKTTKEDWTWFKNYKKGYDTALKLRAQIAHIRQRQGDGQIISDSDIKKVDPDASSLNPGNPNDANRIVQSFTDNNNFTRETIAAFEADSRATQYTDGLTQTIAVFNRLRALNNNSFQHTLRKALGDKVYNRLENLSNASFGADSVENQNKLNDFNKKHPRELNNSSNSRIVSANGVPEKDEDLKGVLLDVMKKHSSALAFINQDSLTDEYLQKELAEIDPPLSGLFGTSRMPKDFPPEFMVEFRNIVNSKSEQKIFDAATTDQLYEAAFAEMLSNGWRPQTDTNISGSFNWGVLGRGEIPFYPGQSVTYQGEETDEFVWTKGGIEHASQITMPPELRADGGRVKMGDIQHDTKKVMEKFFPGVDFRNVTFRYTKIPGTDNDLAKVFHPIAMDNDDQQGVVEEFSAHREVALPRYSVEYMDDDGQWRRLNHENGMPIAYQYNWSDTNGPNAYVKALEDYKSSWMRPIIESKVTDLVGVTPGNYIVDAIQQHEGAFQHIDDVKEFGKNLNKILNMFGAPSIDLSAIDPDEIAAGTSTTQDLAFALDMAYLKLLGNAGVSLVADQFNTAVENIQSGMNGTKPIFSTKSVVGNVLQRPASTQSTPQQAAPQQAALQNTNIQNSMDMEDAADDITNASTANQAPTTGISYINDVADISSNDDSIKPASVKLPNHFFKNQAAAATVTGATHSVTKAVSNWGELGTTLEAALTSANDKNDKDEKLYIERILWKKGLRGNPANLNKSLSQVFTKEDIAEAKHWDVQEKGEKIVTDLTTEIGNTFNIPSSYLRRIAQAESRYGKDKGTFTGNDQGIWQFNKLGWKETQRKTTILDKARNRIYTEYGIVWANVTRKDLHKPVYAALAAMLHIVSRLNIDIDTDHQKIPEDQRAQGEIWKKWYNSIKGKGTVAKWMERTT